MKYLKEKISQENIKHEQLKKGRQCTYNVTMRRVHETIVAVEKKKLLHISLCVCERARVSACALTRVCVGARARACSYAV